MNNVVLGAVTAYGLALREGFVGTLQEWLDSLHARIGENGNWWVGDTDTGVLADPSDLQELTRQAEESASFAKNEADRVEAIVEAFSPNHITDAEREAWNSKAEKPDAVIVTLTADGWNSTAKTQTVTAVGVLADESKQLITPTPAAASRVVYYDAGIFCTGQAAGTLTFTARKGVPSVDLTVYVTIQEVKA